MQDTLDPITARFQRTRQKLREMARAEGANELKRVTLGTGYTVRWRQELFDLVAQTGGCQTLPDKVHNRRWATVIIVGDPDVIKVVCVEYRRLRNAILDATQVAYQEHVQEVERWNEEYGSVWVTSSKRIDLCHQPTHSMRFYGEYCDGALAALRETCADIDALVSEDVLSATA